MKIEQQKTEITELNDNTSRKKLKKIEKHFNDCLRLLLLPVANHFHRPHQNSLQCTHLQTLINEGRNGMKDEKKKKAVLYLYQ